MYKHESKTLNHLWFRNIKILSPLLETTNIDFPIGTYRGYEVRAPPFSLSCPCADNQDCWLMVQSTFNAYGTFNVLTGAESKCLSECLFLPVKSSRRFENSFSKPLGFLPCTLEESEAKTSKTLYLFLEYLIFQIYPVFRNSAWLQFRNIVTKLSIASMWKTAYSWEISVSSAVS